MSLSGYVGFRPRFFVNPLLELLVVDVCSLAINVFTRDTVPLLELLQPPVSWFKVVVTKSESKSSDPRQHNGSNKWNALCTSIHEPLVCSFHSAVSGTSDSFPVSAANVVVENGIYFAGTLDGG